MGTVQKGKLLKSLTHYGVYHTRLSEILYYSSNRTVQQYKTMRMYPIIWLGLNFIKLGLGRIPFNVICDDKDIQEITRKAFEPIWPRMIKEAGECLDFGFKAMELRYKNGSLKYKVEDDNDEEQEKDFEGIILKSPKGLDGESIDILIEEDGSFKGFRQYPTVDILADELKALLFTNHLESGQFYGISAQEPIYPFWYDAIINRQFHMRWLERKGTGIWQGRYPDGKSLVSGTMTDHKDIMLGVLDNLLEGTTVALPSDQDANGNYKWDISIIDSEDKTDHFITRGKYLDERMLLGLIVPEKAMTQGEVGSYSSVAAFQDMFMLRKQSFYEDLVDTIDKYMVSNFAKINFGDHPELHILPGQLSDESKEFAFRVGEKLVENGTIKVPNKWLLQKTGMPFEEKEEEEEYITPEPGKIEYEKQDTRKKEIDIEDEKEIENLKMSEAQNRWVNMTDREKKFKLNELSSAFDDLSSSFQADLLAEAQRQGERIKKYIEKNFYTEKSSIIVFGIEINVNPFKRILRDYLTKIYDTAFNQFANSLDISLQVDMAEYTEGEFISMRVDLTSEQIRSKLEQSIKYQVGNLFSGQTGLPEVKTAIDEIIDDFDMRQTALISENEIGFTLGQANKNFYDTVNKMVKKGVLPEEEEIQRFQYSAIMDSKVCDLCASINGTIVRADSSIMSKYQTPLHYMCRCVWLPITKGEIEDQGYEDTDLSVDENTGRPLTIDNVNKITSPYIKLKTFCECGAC